MEYRLYKLKFKTGVHFGKRTLDDSEITICADTIFSAICHEYLKQGEDRLKDFAQKAAAGKILISDALPYINDTYYVPKPMLKIDTGVTDNASEGSSVLKKAYKSLSYVPADQLENYLCGNMDVVAAGKQFKDGLGKKVIKTSACVRKENDTEPYRVGTYYFNREEGKKKYSGLYIIIGCEDKDDMYDLGDCIDSLGYSGIGGRRSAGLGRFEAEVCKMPEQLFERIDGDGYGIYMSLSVCLPKENELEMALDGANYLLLKRSGFVASENYKKKNAEEAAGQMKKRDLYVMKAGSCFKNKFEGDVYDVNHDGSHSVYRYAKPLFMGVKL